MKMAVVAGIEPAMRESWPLVVVLPHVLFALTCLTFRRTNEVPCLTTWLHDYTNRIEMPLSYFQVLR